MPVPMRNLQELRRYNALTDRDEQFCARGDHWVPLSEAYDYHPTCRPCQVAARRARRGTGTAPTPRASRPAAPGRYDGAYATRSFGVEVEFNRPAGVHTDAVLYALRAAGLAVLDGRYSHEGFSRTDWTLKRDGSLGRRGLELVSPPLVGAEGLRQVDVALAALRGVGCSVSAACGLHVHHDASDLGLTGAIRLLEIYRDRQAEIDLLIAPSRRSTSWHSYCGRVDTTLVRLRAATSLDQNQVLTFSRYCNVNVASYPKYGTLELRQHQGTLNFRKVARWVLLGQELMQQASRDVREIAAVQSRYAGTAAEAV